MVAEDDYEPSPEEEESSRRMYELAERYPTFLLLMKVLQRHRRLRRLRNLRAPQQIIDSDRQMREEALDALADAFPYDSENNLFSLPDILNTLMTEFRKPHEKGGSDA